MRRIRLTRRQYAIVDSEDFNRVNQWKWYAQWQGGSFYAVRNIRLPNGKRTLQRMHRLLLGLEYGDERQVDHINHDTLDNRRANLRIVSCRGNAENMRNQSKYGPGVERHRSRFRARARLNGGGKVQIGTFDSAEEAREARQEFLRQHAS